MKWYKTVTYEVEADSRHEATGLWETGGPEIAMGYPILVFEEGPMANNPVESAIAPEAYQNGDERR